MSRRLNLNLSINGLYAWAGDAGQLTLSPQTFREARGVLPSIYSGVQLTCYAERALDIHLALYHMPSKPGHVDGALVSTYVKGQVVYAKTDVAGLGVQPQTITVLTPQSVPGAIVVPASYVFAVWIDDVPTTVQDTAQRSTAPGYVNARVPARAFVYDIGVI